MDLSFADQVQTVDYGWVFWLAWVLWLRYWEKRAVTPRYVSL